MRASEYIRNLATSGVHHFTTADALTALGGNPPAVRAQLRRLKQQELLAEPVRSFHVIVPPEHRRLGCLPAEHFIDHLMQVWGEPYYVCLLSAAERHGAAHQRPQATQVMKRKNRQSIDCGMIRINFIARSDLEQMPVTKLNTPRGVVRYSSPEVTAIELVGYPGHPRQRWYRVFSRTFSMVTLFNKEVVTGRSHFPQMRTPLAGDPSESPRAGREHGRLVYTTRRLGDLVYTKVGPEVRR